MFPITNISGRTIAFGARALRADDEPKYLNSPETPIYRKSGVLYGLGLLWCPVSWNVKFPPSFVRLKVYTACNTIFLT